LGRGEGGKKKFGITLCAYRPRVKTLVDIWAEGKKGGKEGKNGSISMVKSSPDASPL